ncbi:PIN-like domain-containing protein [Micromonospora sp. NBC_01412]|uniref:PIN-like domain-containing protein n=1 Tax=Micromonospora sp. NBC_01412 TaxID=2903590 RepID=UPI003247F632
METEGNSGNFEDFPGWLPQDEDRANFFTSATIVLDANVLLAFYRISPTARDELLAILREVRERVWIPHQVALEFMRNREKVIADRNSRFTEVKRAIQSTPERIASEIYASVESLQKLRAALVTPEEWKEESHNLSLDALKKTVTEMLKPALTELDRIKSDYDLKHSEIQNGEDVVLRNLQEILSGRIGKAWPAEKVRQLVKEAIEFRYPNEIPPGYLDLKTKLPARAAGDFILWAQLIEMLGATRVEGSLVALVTADAKADWWQINGKNEPVSARPELVQELHDQACAKLLLLTLDDFLEGSRNYLKKDVSPSTVAEAREVIAEERREEYDRPSQKDTLHWLRKFDPGNLEIIARDLLILEGYTIRDHPNSSIDILAERGGELFAVEVTVKGVGIGTVIELNKKMKRSNIPFGMIMTTGTVTNAALGAARAIERISIVDGDEFADLVDEHFHARNDEL